MNPTATQLLIVEDNPGDVRLLKEMLRRSENHDVFILTVAGRIDEALLLLETQSFDAVMLDLTLPDGRGLSSVKRLQTSSPDTPIIVITGLADPAMPVDAMRVGAQDYLAKDSLNSESIVRAIHYAIERTKIKNELIKQEAQYRLLAENITDMIVRHAPDSTIDYVSPSCRTLLGYEPEEMIGVMTGKFVHPDDLPIFNSVREKSLQMLNNYTTTYRIRHKNGTYRWFETTENVTRNSETQAVIETISVSRDITQRHNAEEYTRLLQTAIEQTDDAIIVMTAEPELTEAQIVFVNPAFTRLTGYLPEDLIGKKRSILHDHLSDPNVSKQVSETLSRGDTFRSKSVNLRKNGTEYEVEWNIAPIWDSSGTITHYVCAQHDTTERRRQERALVDSEERFRALVQNATDIITVLGTDMTVIYESPSLEKVTGYKLEAVQGLSITDVVHPEDLPLIMERMISIFDQPAATFIVEVRLRHADGSWRTQEATVTNLLDHPAIHGIVINSRDITERKRAQQKLLEERSLLRTLIDNIPDYIFVKDSESRMIVSNQAQADALGAASPEETLGKTDLDFLDHHEAERIIADDQVILQTGKALLNREESITHRTTGRQTWLDTTKVPLRNGEGNVIGIVGIGRDISERKRAEQKLLEERSLLRTLIDNIPDYIYVKDRQSRVVVSNQAHAAILGAATPEETLGKTDFDFFARHEAEHFFADDQAILQSGRALLNHEESATSQITGRLRWVDTTKVPLRDSEGNVIGIVGIGRDITERKRVEESIRFQAQLLNTVGQAVIATNMESKITYWNRAAETLYGWSAQEALGCSSVEIILADTSREQAEEIMTHLRSGESWSGEFTVRGKDGKAFPVLVTDTPIIDENGAQTGIIGVSMDISERRLAEEALKQSEQLLRTILETLPIGVVITDAKGQVTHLNPASQQIWAGAKYVGVGQYEEYKAWWVDSGKRVEAHEWGAARAVASGETSLNEELEIERFDGVHRFMLNSAVPILNSDGDVTAVVAVNQDITERKRAELALQRYNQRLGILHGIDRSILTAQSPARLAQTMVELLPSMIGCESARIYSLLREDAPTQLAVFPADSWSSEDLMRLLGSNYGIPEPLRRGETLHFDNIEQVIALSMPAKQFLTGREGRSSIIVPMITGDHLIGLLDIMSAQPSALTADHLDILHEIAAQLAIALHKNHLDEQIQEYALTLEARVAERTEQLHAAKERIEAVLRSSSDAILVAKMDGSIEVVNPAFNTLFGYTVDQGLAMSLFSLVGSANATTLRRALDEIVVSGNAKRVEFVAIRQDGTFFHADAAFAPIIKELPSLFFCSIRDITLYKQAEEGLRTALAREKELNELKTSFTSLVSHEFRTPLAVILSSADLLSKYSERMDESRRNEKLENIVRQVKRMIKLLDDVLAITRSESIGFEFKPTTLDLVALSEEIIEEVRFGYRQDITIEFTHQGDCRVISGDEFLFSHILQNLTTNAIKYSNKGGMVRILLTCQSAALTIRVEDQGIGIPEEHQSRLFEAFRRAGNVRQIQGTGIGLTIVKRAVDAYGGTIEFESVEGQGTTFIVNLPTTHQERGRIYDEN